MKKLLLVLMVVALAAFLLVGCIPVTPPNGEEGEDEVEICPTVNVTSQVAVGGKTYIKGGEKQTITVTFTVPTAPVSVYVGEDLRANPVGVPDDAAEVVMYANADKTVYTGEFEFADVWYYYYDGDTPELVTWQQECGEDYIYVVTCDTCAPCKSAYTVDTVHPYAKIEVTADECSCEGIALTFANITLPACEACVCCDDECSGLASWAIDIYDKYPFDKCCDTPCAAPVHSCSGVCPVACTTTCLTGYSAEDKNVTYYVLTTLLDGVGNKARYYVKIVMDSALDAALAASTKPVAVPLTEYAQDKCGAECDLSYTGMGVCSWFYNSINRDYDTGEYGFCSEWPDNVIPCISEP